MIFSPVMRFNTGALGVPVKEGYYQVHGVSDDEENNACDDFHQNDLWMILAQGAGGYDKQILLSNTEKFIDLWEQFWDQDFTQNKIESMRKSSRSLEQSEVSILTA